MVFLFVRLLILKRAKDVSEFFKVIAVFVSGGKWAAVYL